MIHEDENGNGKLTTFRRKDACVSIAHMLSSGEKIKK